MSKQEKDYLVWFKVGVALKGQLDETDYDSVCALLGEAYLLLAEGKFVSFLEDSIEDGKSGNEILRL